MLSAPVISILPIAPASIMTAFVSCFRWSSISRTSTFAFAKTGRSKSVNNHTVNLVDVCALPDIAEMTVSRLHTEKAGGRLCASDYHLGKRQNDSYQNSVYRTQNKYSEKAPTNMKNSVLLTFHSLFAR